MKHMITDRERRDREHYGSKGPKDNSWAHEKRRQQAEAKRAKMEKERKETIVKAAKAIKRKQAQSLMSALESL